MLIERANFCLHIRKYLDVIFRGQLLFPSIKLRGSLIKRDKIEKNF